MQTPSAAAAATVHNLRTEAMRRGDVRIDRGTPHRNPFVPGRDGTRAEVVARFEARERERIARDPARRAAVAALHGKRLFCWCQPPSPCHGGVLARLAAELVAAEEAPPPG